MSATKRSYEVDLNYDGEWQTLLLQTETGIKQYEASSAAAAITAAKKAANGAGYSMPRGTKWRARRVAKDDRTKPLHRKTRR